MLRLRAENAIGRLISDGGTTPELHELLECMVNTQRQLEACLGLAPTYQARVVPLLLADFAQIQAVFVRRYYIDVGQLLT